KPRPRSSSQDLSWESPLLHHIGPVQRVALCGNVSGVGNDAAQLGFVGAVGHACREDDIFLDQNASDIVGAELQTDLADLDSLREPARLDVIDVVEIEPADGERLQIVDSGGLR